MSRIAKLGRVIVLAIGTIWADSTITASTSAVPQYVDDPDNIPGVAMSGIQLNGTAAGGTLILTYSTGGGSVSIDTQPGETAESVIGRLAAKINKDDPFNWWGNREAVHWTAEEGGVKPVGNTLKRLPLMDMVFAGTETGLGIPQPPRFLSASYDPAKNELTLQWENPTQDCDTIRCSGMKLPPTATKCVLELKDLADGFTRTSLAERPFDVVISRWKTPSCAGVITVHTNAQEDFGCIPFYDGVMPNWAKWSTSSDPSDIEFEQDVKPNAPKWRLQGADGLGSGPYHQVIKAKKPGVQGGIWRKYLNLKPGHTYRVIAHLSTFGMDADTNDWSFSLHAAYNSSPGENFTPAQFRGAAALPNGKHGPDAGRIVSYGRGKTTDRKWVARSTGDPDSAGQGDITLPPNVTSISVWLRCDGTGSSGVGLDCLRLEDVTPGLKE